MQVIFNKKHVGDIINNVFVSERDYKKHFFRVFNGFAESIAILDYLQSLSIEDILITCDGRVYHATVDCFLVYGKEYDNPLIKGDKQLVLEINKWKIKMPTEKINFVVQKHLNSQMC